MRRPRHFSPFALFADAFGMILIRNGNRYIRTRELRTERCQGDSHAHEPDYDADRERRVLAHQRRIQEYLHRHPELS